MIARNIVFNLTGMLAPVLLAFLCIPPLIQAMGVGAFGVLTLVWVVLGYFSLFDIGIGRALTKAVAERTASGDTRTLPALVRTATLAALVLGALGGMLMLTFRHSLVDGLLGDGFIPRDDLSSALLLVALALPSVTATAALRGSLEATQRFGVVNLVRLAMGVFSYVGPLLVVQFSSTLQAVVGFLLIGRIAFFLLHLVLVLRAFPRLPGERALRPELLRPLLATGSWMAVSNIVSPLLTYLDRLVVAAVTGSALLAYYSTPYEAIMRATVVPDAVMGVMFPAFAAVLQSDPAQARQMLARTFRLLLAAMAPLMLTVMVLAHELLQLWVGADFATRSTTVLQILALGILVNAMARLPFTVIHSAGRPDLTAKAHIIELLPFIAVLWMLAREWGIVGAALAWMLRAAVDAVVLECMRRVLVPGSLGLSLVRLGAVLAIVLAALVLAWARPGIALAVPASAMLTLALWAAVLTTEDRRSLVAMAERVRVRMGGRLG